MRQLNPTFTAITQTFPGQACPIAAGAAQKGGGELLLPAWDLRRVIRNLVWRAEQMRLEGFLMKLGQHQRMQLSEAELNNLDDEIRLLKKTLRELRDQHDDPQEGDDLAGTAKKLELYGRACTRIANIVKTYNGKLMPLRTDLEKYMDSLRVPLTLNKPDGSDLLNSLLSSAESNMDTDWAIREHLQARMKVDLRKVLIQFGVNDSAAKECAERLVSWFQTQSVVTGQMEI